MDMLSQADRVKGRMERNQHWSLLKYVYELMSIGVALSKDEPYKGFTRYSYPSKIKKMGRSRSRRRKRDDIAAKIASTLHTSFSDAKAIIPFIGIYLQHEQWRESIIEKMELTEDEIGFIADY
jgi:replication factor C large subunit